MASKRLAASVLSLTAAASAFLAVQPARATSFNGCYDKTAGTTAYTYVSNVTCDYVRAYAYDYEGGGYGATKISPWVSTAVKINGSNITSHGDQVRAGGATSAWHYF